MNADPKLILEGIARRFKFNVEGMRVSQNTLDGVVNGIVASAIFSNMDSITSADCKVGKSEYYADFCFDIFYHGPIAEEDLICIVDYFAKYLPTVTKIGAKVKEDLIVRAKGTPEWFPFR